MATTIGQHPITAFTTPTNGTSPIDADEVRDNDNAVRTAYNAHDEDTGIHVQSSVIGSRPAAGTQGRKWLSVDSVSAPTQVQLNYDGGAAWYALNYFPGAITVAAGGADITGNVVLSADLTVDTTTLKVDATNNRVGVGTVTPSHRLHVVSSGDTYVRVQDSSGGGGSMYIGYANANAGYLEATAAMAMAAGGSERMRILTTGEVGIGTATPSTKLEVAGTVTVSTGGIAVTGNSTITGTLGGITGLTVASGGASIGGGATITGSAIVTADLTVDTSTLKVDSANNRVGVGTASPAVPLDVAAGSTTNALVVTTTGAIQQSLRYNSSNRLDISVGSTGIVTLDPVGSSSGFILAANTLNVDGTTPTLALNESSVQVFTLGGAADISYNVVGSGDSHLFKVNGSTVVEISGGTLTATGAVQCNAGLTVSSANNAAIGTSQSASAYLNIAAGSTNRASLRLAHGSAPTSPVDGDIWTTTAGLFVRINGSTIGPLS